MGDELELFGRGLPALIGGSMSALASEN